MKLQGSEAGKDDYEYTVDNSIDQIGWGKFQLKLLIVVAAAKGCMAMQLVLHAFNVHELKHEWKLSKGERYDESPSNNSTRILTPTLTPRTFIAGSIFWGMLFGSSFWGVMSDKYGQSHTQKPLVLFISLFGWIFVVVYEV